MNRKPLLLVAMAATAGLALSTAVSCRDDQDKGRIQVGGVFPQLAIVSGHIPRTEAGIGALIPWAGRLWAVGYVAHIKGSGLGLCGIDENMELRRRPENATGTFANRMVHNPSNQAIIGPHIIDTESGVRTFPELFHHRLTSTMEHLADPDNKVYFLTMEGFFFEADVHTLESRELFDLAKELGIPEGAQPHFKSGDEGRGRISS